MKKPAALLKLNMFPHGLTALLLGTAALLAGFTPAPVVAQSCANPPPTPQGAGAVCDLTPACFLVNGQPAYLPQKPCEGNYVCRQKSPGSGTTAPVNTCQCAFGSFEMPFLDNQRGVDVCTFVKGTYSSPFVALVAILDQLSNYLIAIIVALAMVMVTFGGYIYLTAGGDSTKISTAKKIIATALLGVLLALMAWLILNTISPQFTLPRDPLPTP